MSRARWILVQDADHWQIGRMTPEGPVIQDVESPAEATPQVTAQHIAEGLAVHGYKGEGILLAVASAECLVRSIPISSGTSARNRNALAYAFEEWLPLAAEDLATDFVVSDGETLGVGIQASGVGPLMDALEALGVVVQSVCPTALLALQEHATHADEELRHVVLWGYNDQIELFLLDRGTPRQWQVLPRDMTALARQLEVMALGHAAPLKVVAYDLTEESAHTLSTLSDVQPQGAGSKKLLAAAVTAADQVLVGNRRPWVDLRRGVLATRDPHRPVRGRLRFAHGALALFLAALAVAMFVRAQRSTQLARDYLDLQASIFRATLPGQPVPVGIRSRLESEYTKLAGLTGTSADLPPSTSALVLLHDVLAALPNGARYRLLEIRLEEERVYLEGEVRSHGDADTIASALRSGGFQVEPPRSEQLADGAVTVRIAAILPIRRSPTEGRAL